MVKHAIKQTQNPKQKSQLSILFITPFVRDCEYSSKPVFFNTMIKNDTNKDNIKAVSIITL